MDDWSTSAMAKSQSSGGSNSANITISSKPQVAASSLPTGKRQHTPIAIGREIDRASPLMLTISAGDVDGDGMVDVAIAVKKQGVPSNSNTAKPAK